MDDTIQCKNVAGGVNYHTLIAAMLKSGRRHPVIFHKRTSRRAERIVIEGHYCTTRMETYLELMACRQAIQRINQLLTISDDLDGAKVAQILKELGL